MNKIIFHNSFHVGDVIISKPFVREIMKHFNGYDFYYSHRNNRFITEDLCPSINNISMFDNEFIKVCGDTIFINTWFGILQNKNLRIITEHNGICHFEFQLDQFNYLFKKHNINIDLTYMETDVEKYLWEIDDKYIGDKLVIRDGINVLIYNIPSKSGQADYIDADVFIDRLSDKFPNVNFYITSSNLQKANVICLNKCFDVRGIDLFQYAELSKRCNIIVGNGSGPIMNSWIKTNLLNANKIYIINHRYNDGECKFYSRQLAQSIRVLSTKDMYNKLEGVLHEL